MKYMTMLTELTAGEVSRIIKVIPESKETIERLCKEMVGHGKASKKK